MRIALCRTLIHGLQLDETFIHSSRQVTTLKMQIQFGTRISLNNSYFLNNYPLTSSNPIRDLGILINDNLSYKSHINSIVSKSLQRVGVLFRGFLCRDLPFLRKAFITYVRPLIEYNSILWSPNQKKYIDLIEKVQRRFTKRIPCLHTLPYLDRLKAINLPSLELRRLHFDLFYYYKILHNLTDINPDIFFHLPHSFIFNYFKIFIQAYPSFPLSTLLEFITSHFTLSKFVCFF